VGLKTLTNCDVYTGEGFIPDGTIIIDGSRIVKVGSRAEITSEGTEVDLGGCTVTPGFIDLQVNGGDDVLFNDVPTVETLQRMANGHAKFGSTGILPTFTTGPPSGMVRAREAVTSFRSRGGSQILGIHFEGPAISPERLGVHERAFVSRDFPIAVVEGATFPTMVTLAPEVVDPGVIRRLVGAGVRVSLGYSNGTYEEAIGAIREGATCATHLYNAMSPLTGRAPGVVGACLSESTVFVDVIADGIHCHFGSVRVAWSSKPRGMCFLVTDAMPPVGGSGDAFHLGELAVTVKDGRCITADGTLAGSALDMATAVRNCVQEVGISKDEAFRMASLYPARYLGVETELGSIAAGMIANLVICDNEVFVQGVVIDGELRMDSRCGGSNS
jgi:N-acetylglucosamine-6-phosphate deacetylase